LNAINFSAEKHKSQRRKGDDSPYINHPIGVAFSIYHDGGIQDLDIFQAAILHDTVEDTNTTLDEIEKIFGSKVRGLVAEVSDDKSLSKEKRKKLQIEHAPGVSKEAKIIKMADKLYNMRDILNIPPKGWNLLRIQGYYVWAFKVVEGLRGANSSLEKALDDVFKCEITFEGKKYPALPPKGEMDKLLEEYYKSL